MEVTGQPLDANTTSIQVTVAGHADLSGIYNLTSGGSGFDWAQQGGNGQIVREQNSQYNYHWLVSDNSDGNPYSTFGSGLVSETDSRPWKETDTGILLMAPVPETLTVDHTAVPKTVAKETTFGGSQSITIKRDIEPLLSKVVGGAAAAYSLRDLNDKAGNNKVVDVRRSSGGEQAFLAKEVSNGTLTAWVGAGNDGFVSKWYDQSGNGNDAVQPTSTSQPKIVSSGSLVTGGLRFDDAQKLETAGTFSFASGTTLSTFITNKSDGDEAAYLFRFVSDYIVYNTAGGVRRAYAGANANSGTLGSDEELWTTISTLNSSGGTANFFANGTLVSSADTNIGTRTVSSKVLNIGGSSSSNHWNGTVNEVVFYATDQTSNRAAIEANINNQYDIY
jgi:hypothetical protein